MNSESYAEDFIKWLTIEKGFPQNMLRREFAVIDEKTKEALRPDLIVLDPYRAGFAAVFEFIGQREEINSPEHRQKLMRYRAALGKISNAAYLIRESAASSQRFSIHQVFSEQSSTEISPSDFPDYSNLLLGETAKWKAENDQQTDVAMADFRKLCWYLAAAVGVLLILDIVKVVSISAQRLSLIGLAVGLVLVPYAAKLKVLGIEWERYKPEANENTRGGRK